jgi:hypothetical protein
MNKTATEVVFELLNESIQKEAAIGGILNTGLAKQIIRDARRLASNNKALKSLPDYNDMDTLFKIRMANKGLKHLDDVSHGFDSDAYVDITNTLNTLRKSPFLRRDSYFTALQKTRRHAFENMMKDVDPQGFIPKYKKIESAMRAGDSGAGRRKVVPTKVNP